MNRIAEIEAARLRRASNVKVLEPYTLCDASLRALKTCEKNITGFEKWSALHADLLRSENEFSATCGADPNGYFWFSLSGVTKVSEMRPVLKHFASRGWRRSGAAILPNGSTTSISYFLIHPAHMGAHLEVRSHIQTGGGTNTCKMIEVGKKTVPVYELQCPEDNLNEEEVVI